MSQLKKFGEPFSSSEAMGELSTAARYDKGSILIHSAETDNRVFFILSGEVKVSNFSDEGIEVWHSAIGQGHFVGEMAALSGAERTANVEALKKTEVLVFSQKQFVNLLERDSDVSLWLMRQLVERLSATTNDFYNFYSKTAHQRVREALIELCPDEPNANGDFIISPKPNLTKLATKLHTRREVVSREIARLEKKGVLRREAKQIVYFGF